jgi:hypothetical protein
MMSPVNPLFNPDETLNGLKAQLGKNLKRLPYTFLETSKTEN